MGKIDNDFMALLIFYFSAGCGGMTIALSQGNKCWNNYHNPGRQKEMER